MRLRAKLLATLACGLTIWAGSTAPTEAGVVPGLWNGLFGSVSQGYVADGYVTSYGPVYAGYAPVYTNYGSSYSNYAPVYTSYSPVWSGAGYGTVLPRRCCRQAWRWSAFSGFGLFGRGAACGTCAPVCAPACGTCGPACGPCGPVCGDACASGCNTGCGTACASNTCGVSGQAAAPLTPVPDNRNFESPQQTYRDEPMPGGGAPPVAPGASPAPGPARPPASAPDAPAPNSAPAAAPGFGPAKQRPANVGNPDSSAFKPPVEKPAPADPKKNTTPPPKIPEDKDDGKEAGQGPTLNLDEKVTWRATPERRRLTIKPAYTHARLVRMPAYPESDWMPVNGDSKLAKK